MPPVRGRLVNKDVKSPGKALYCTTLIVKVLFSVFWMFCYNGFDAFSMSVKFRKFVWRYFDWFTAWGTSCIEIHGWGRFPAQTSLCVMRGLMNLAGRNTSLEILNGRYLLHKYFPVRRHWVAKDVTPLFRDISLARYVSKGMAQLFLDISL